MESEALTAGGGGERKRVVGLILSRMRGSKAVSLAGGEWKGYVYSMNMVTREIPSNTDSSAEGR